MNPCPAAARQTSTASKLKTNVKVRAPQHT
jgi:hypothetical protein